MFDPPDDMKGQYDLVMSFGVVEHFKDTTACLKACAAFVKPGGQMFTMIPNMTGLVGSLQKIIDRNVYDIHVPLSCKMLMATKVTDNSLKPPAILSLEFSKILCEIQSNISFP